MLAFEQEQPVSKPKVRFADLSTSKNLKFRFVVVLCMVLLPDLLSFVATKGHQRPRHFAWNRGWNGPLQVLRAALAQPENP